MARTCHRHGRDTDFTQKSEVSDTTRYAAHFVVSVHHSLQSLSSLSQDSPLLTSSMQDTSTPPSNGPGPTTLKAQASTDVVPVSASESPSLTPEQIKELI